MKNETIKILLTGLGSAGLLEATLQQARSPRFDLQHANPLSRLLQWLSEERVDIVLVNFAPSAARGLTDVFEIHNHAPEVPIVVLADSSQEVFASQALQEGAQEYLLHEEMTAPLLGRVLRYAMERQRLQSELVRQCVYDDALTGLPNRQLYLDRLRQAQAHARRYGQLTGVLFLDLDEFKEINDSWGHAVGDQLLQAVAQRLSGCIRETDTVARLGGDEFTFVLRDLEKPRGAVTVARKILHQLACPFPLGGRALSITASIGLSLSPHDGIDADILLHKADMAMYQAKRAGKNTFRVHDGSKSFPAPPTPVRNSSRKGSPHELQHNGRRYGGVV